MIKISKWSRGFRSPLLFMVDDLANIYFSREGGDWGGKTTEKDGLFSFLEEHFVARCSGLRFTFFLVAGVRTIQSSGDYDYARSCDVGAFPDFIKYIESKGHEIAYHGLTHGTLLPNRQFVQEWSAFESLEEATETTQKGLSIVSKALGRTIRGGKFCGYESGSYGHNSLVENNIAWWFDKWDENELARPDGELIDSVFYFPSNVDCSRYGLEQIFNVPLKKYLTSNYRSFFHGSIKRKISKIYQNQGIITLQEHTSPLRTDGVIQYPNVVSDKPQIQTILDYISDMSIWYATATEVYCYIMMRRNTKLLETDNELVIEFTGSSKLLNYLIGENTEITILLDRNIELPIGYKVECNKNGMFFQIPARKLQQPLQFKKCKGL
ncbi:hypothetical protein N9W11_04915 [Psychrosphaera haliotis]|nr:hypothetical protein [Psychrosphaera haliotis]